MNILICGKLATGKTSLAKFILPYLKEQGQVVTLQEEELVYSRLSKNTSDKILTATKGKNKYHFLATSQSIEFIYPSVLSQMDIIIMLQGKNVGRWLYQLACVAKGF